MSQEPKIKNKMTKNQNGEPKTKMANQKPKWRGDRDMLKKHMLSLRGNEQYIVNCKVTVS